MSVLSLNNAHLHVLLTLIECSDVFVRIGRGFSVTAGNLLTRLRHFLHIDAANLKGLLVSLA